MYYLCYALLYCIIFAFGAAIGSFLNVCIYRLPKEESLWRNNSHCMTCGTPIRKRDLIPIFSWCRLRGKCHSCGAKIPFRYTLVESLNAVLYVLIYAYCLMKDGIGAGYTREDHVTLSNQLFACYAKVQDAKALASVIGEEELSQSDKQLMAFGRAFEQEFIGQGNTDRTMEQTLDLGWELLATLPRNALDRCDAATLDKYYEPAKARISKK